MASRTDPPLGPDGKLYVEYVGGDDFKVEEYVHHIDGYPPLRWNVTLAKALVRQGQVLTTVDVPREELVNITTRNEWDPAHAALVDCAQPGIAAPIIWEGRLTYMPIDGTHRCARALQLGVPMRMQLLTDDAAKRCYSGPVELMPWGTDAHTD